MTLDTNQWKKEYFEYMKKEDYENAMPLKYKHFPKSFFKYRKLDNYTLNCLEYNWLWMSEIEKLNDPFESSLLLDNNEILRNFFGGEIFKKQMKEKYKVDFSEKEINQLKNSLEPFKTFISVSQQKNVNITISPEQQIKNALDSWGKDMNRQNETIRICSFSTSCESLLMWSHYSDNHKGICLEYDFLNTEVNDEIRAFLQPVFYSDERMKIKSIPEITLINKVMASTCKSLDWEYEQEWRLTFFLPRQIEGKNNRINVPQAIAIYLGPKFDLNPEYERLQLLRIAKEKNIKIYQMIVHETEYKLIPTFDDVNTGK